MPTPAAPKPKCHAIFWPRKPHTSGATITEIWMPSMKIWKASARRRSPGA